jgi:hypothetical protein
VRQDTGTNPKVIVMGLNHIPQLPRSASLMHLKMASMIWSVGKFSTACDTMMATSLMGGTPTDFGDDGAEVMRYREGMRGCTGDPMGAQTRR